MQEGAWTDFSKRKKRKEKKSRLKPPLLSSGNGDKYKDHATKGKQPGTLIKKKKRGACETPKKIKRTDRRHRTNLLSTRLTLANPNGILNIS